ncbi:alpha/beta fold hydrolase [Streptomyces pilosus]|uniref:alpha/beta fold hydrolase n=1 Tax=Streptomyces pilosus TaxID=28893 RepID=UPI003628FE5C
MPRIRATPAGRRRAAVVAALLTGSAVLTGPSPATAGGAPPPASAVPRLDWSRCVPGSAFDCATARVPLDHDEPGGRTIELAVVRRKAADPDRRVGTLFFNPGGPGGPGTVQMPQNYASFPQEVRERFDIVSWDPRGVGSSTAVNCFASPGEAAEWSASRPAGFPVGEAERAEYAASYEELGRRCEQRDPALLRHVSTADTARDLDLLLAAVGEDRLNYLGISYGTMLGATYANLFPGKVRAMILDSNWDPRAWTDDASDEDPRLTSFQRLGSDLGAAETLDRFLTLCGTAGTDRCAFSAGSPEATRDKFEELMVRLRERPVEGWTYAGTIAAAVSGFYVVHPGWTRLAATLQELWQGRVPAPVPLPPPPAVPEPDPYLGEEQSTAVFCGDSPHPRDPSAYHALEDLSAARAGDTGRFWVWSSAGCAGWPAVAEHRYRGPWDRPTAHPVLVVGTTHDPSTPFTGAQAMAEQLAGARLLTHRGHGHTALLNPSRCVQAYESRYLVDGTLPPPGTTCEQDTPPFGTPRPSGGVATGGGGTAGALS